ncbi:MAG: lysylphosphatidylglycerol synthase transmembrane domain-containing protein [Silvibacterium sp.]
MKKKTWILYLVVVLALVALLLYARHKIHFNWSVFLQQLKLANWSMIGLAAALILLGYVVRAIRWALFLKPVQKISFPSRAWFDVLGAQIIGFTGVALLGRPADLVRPYLVARRIKLPLSSQIAVYVVERMFDLGATALIFSTALFFAADRATLPHPELLRHIALVGLAGTAALAILATAVRISGKTIAIWSEKIIGKLSESLGSSVGAKILAFREGLEMLASLRGVASALLLSLFMWGLITVAYLETIRAFVDSPQLHHITLARCLVLMAAGMASSVVQLPVVGWFTQIAVLAAAMQQLFNAAWEPALGCAAVLLIVTFLIVVPTGLIWARLEHVSLRKISEESEDAKEGTDALTAPEPATDSQS